jgi:ribosomal protein S6--L-glutamate ligase
MSNKYRKVILLNGGLKTREAFKAGLSELGFEAYKSKELILHIDASGDIHFLNENMPIHFADSYVFTRLRATDRQFCGILYHYLKATGVPASDAINLSFPNSEEKISQMAQLTMNGLSVPETIIAREESFFANEAYIRSHIMFPLVYKLDGSKGDAVFLVDSYEALLEHISNKPPHRLFLLQKYIPNEFDTRTLVAYGEILGTIKRTGGEGTFLNNVSQGASVSRYKLTKEEEEMAKKAVSVCELDFGGVDFVHTEEGTLILEVNKGPQILGFEEVYGKAVVFKKIAQMLEDKVISSN